jgi:hypothetical protein
MKGKEIFVLITFFVLLFFIFGCGTSAPLREVSVRTETVVKERLVRVEIPADSAVVSALLECDSMNNVRLVELNELKSKRVESKTGFSALDSKQSMLNYRVRVVHDTVFVSAKDSIVYKEIPLRVEIPVEVNRLTGWQSFQIWTGRICGGLAILLVLLTVTKVTKSL